MARRVENEGDLPAAEPESKAAPNYGGRLILLEKQLIAPIAENANKVKN